MTQTDSAIVRSGNNSLSTNLQRRALVRKAAQGELVAQLPEHEYEVIKVDKKGAIISRETMRNKYLRQELGEGIYIDLMHIPGGVFLMGSPNNEVIRSPEFRKYESPPHWVRVPEFFMGRYPVTQAQWKAIASLPQVNWELKSDLSLFKGDNRPVEQVSRPDAVEFCDRLSSYANRSYRLPSEAEWEYACRAGTNTPFHFGATIISALVNCNSGSPYAEAPKGELRRTTTPVDHFPYANAFGLFDMHGNIYEWCQDYWQDNYEGAPCDGSAWLEAPKGVAQMRAERIFQMLTRNRSSESLHPAFEQRVQQNLGCLRGGDWKCPSAMCRSASRIFAPPGFRYGSFGFRVVVSAPGLISP